MCNIKLKWQKSVNISQDFKAVSVFSPELLAQMFDANMLACTLFGNETADVC